MNKMVKLAERMAREIEAETKKAERIDKIKLTLLMIGGVIASFGMGVSIGRMM